MDSSLCAPRSRWILLAVCLVIPTWIVYQAAVLWIADERVNSGSFALMQKGVRLVPGNGDAWDRLGQYSQTNFNNPDPAAAIADYQKALQDDPRSATYWMDLAGAYEDAHQFDQAQRAYARARAAYPLSAEVSWKYGNFLLHRGDISQGYPQIRHALEVAPAYLPLAIQLTWHASGNIHDVLEKVLPPTEDAYSRALDFFVGIQRADLCLTVWQKLIDLHAGLPLSPSSLSFFDLLIAQGRAAGAQRAWTQALAAAGVPDAGSHNGSVVFDGDFTADFSNGGLGWRWNRTDNVSINFDSAPSGVSGRSVRIDFNRGANVFLDSPLQFVPVKSDTAYRFHALLRTAEITTDRGVKFSITDPNHPNAVNVLSDNFTGTHSWTPIDIDLTASSATSFLVIQLLRSPSQLFDNKITGSAWIADVSLLPAPDQPHGASAP